MKTPTALTLIGAVSALALSATGASAQMYDGRYDGRAMYRHSEVGQNINQRLAQLDWQIERGERRGDLTPREAQLARNEFHRIAFRQQQYRADGYTRWEVADLDQRLDRLEAQVRYDRHDDEYRRGSQYGYGYGYERR